MDTTYLEPEPMPSPRFEEMKPRSLQAYLKANHLFMANGDSLNTPAEKLATAKAVAERKAKAFTMARLHANSLNRMVDITSDRLQAYPRGPLGLTPDDVKASAAWKLDNQAYLIAFNALRNFNASYTKLYSEELTYMRNATRAARATALAA